MGGWRGGGDRRGVGGRTAGRGDVHRERDRERRGGRGSLIGRGAATELARALQGERDGGTVLVDVLAQL